LKSVKATVVRDRDESPNTKRERKRLVKDERREQRENKMPKHVKKRKERMNKK
jgi:RIO kinase 1